MKARCVNCLRAWGVSILAKIDPKGYVCPHCLNKKSPQLEGQK